MTSGHLEALSVYKLFYGTDSGMRDRLGQSRQLPAVSKGIGGVNDGNPAATAGDGERRF